MTYYALRNNDFVPNDFIDTYAPMYLKGNVCSIPHIRQTFKKTEDWILNIAEKREWTERDVYNILAWKTGKILCKEYTNYSSFEYAEGCNPETMSLKLYGKDRSIVNLAKYIVANLDELKDAANQSDGIGAFEALSNIEGCEGIGTVYLITLLFFLSGCQQPIYDTYVWRALKAIKNNIQPGSSIPEKETVPEKGKTEDVGKMYHLYKSDLYELFGEKYKSCREIDRALWVYGHYFKDKENPCSN